MVFSEALYTNKAKGYKSKNAGYSTFTKLKLRMYKW